MIAIERYVTPRGIESIDMYEIDEIALSVMTDEQIIDEIEQIMGSAENE